MVSGLTVTVTKRFIPVFSGEEHWNWRGGKPTVNIKGYVTVRAPGHPKAHQNRVFEHVLVAEKALGRYLPEGAQVHHVDEVRTNNSGKNLVICQDGAYHKLLHKRARAYRDCGHANWLWCYFCKTWSPPDQLTWHGYTTYHAACRAADDRKKRRGIK